MTRVENTIKHFFFAKAVSAKKKCPPSLIVHALMRWEIETSHPDRLLFFPVETFIGRHHPEPASTNFFFSFSESICERTQDLNKAQLKLSQFRLISVSRSHSLLITGRQLEIVLRMNFLRSCLAWDKAREFSYCWRRWFERVVKEIILLLFCFLLNYLHETRDAEVQMRSNSVEDEKLLR